MSYRSPYQINDDKYKVPRTPRIYYSLAISEKAPKFRSTITNEFIPAGSIIFQDGAIVVSSIEDVSSTLKYAVLIDDGIWLAPADYDNMEITWFMNHSCESNVARVGGLVYIAKRDIFPHEDLTIDYAALTSDYKDWTLSCNCGSKKCRGTITSYDYKIPHIAKELWAEWLPFIQKKILASDYAK